MKRIIALRPNRDFIRLENTYKELKHEKTMQHMYRRSSLENTYKELKLTIMDEVYHFEACLENTYKELKLLMDLRVL